MGADRWFIGEGAQILIYKCSAQSENWYNSGIVPGQSENSHFVAYSGIVPDNSRIVHGYFIDFD